MKRRDFMRAGAAAGVAAAAKEALGLQTPAVVTRAARPVVVASANGNQFKNGGTETCVVRAFRLMTGGADVLEAVVAGVQINELDPADDSVGYGGLPNAEGVVQLDASCMHGPTKRAGAVAALEGVRTPSL
ncbi:MAG TPA: isoaspartyl peptidase/L-asparaginase, partial [Pyrinomonadaceae bacterium]|nr:isoaspartyl peptidase/L-asparaginase [Pyrinomonadaceae bacterium]